MYWNAQGLSGKICELTALLLQENIDIACITETHFSSKNKTREIKGYHVIRQDRATHMGGLLIYIKDDLNFKEAITGPTKLLETIAISIQSNDRSKPPLTLINTYLPGGARRVEVQGHLKEDLESLTSYPMRAGHGIILLGDLNAKHTAWRNQTCNVAGKILYDFTINSNNSIMFPPEPTYCPPSDKKSSSTIDLLLTNGVFKCSRPFVRNILNSDHVPVFTSVELAADRTIKQMKQYNYGRANWGVYRRSLNSALFETLVNIDSTARINEESIDALIVKLNNDTSRALNKAVPREKRLQNGICLPSDIQALIHRRNYYRRRWCRRRNPSDRMEYSNLNREIKNRVSYLIRDRLTGGIADCRPGDTKIYKLIKARKRSQLPPLQTADGKVYKNVDKAKELAIQFRKSHDNPLGDNRPLFTSGIETHVKQVLRADLGESTDNFTDRREVLQIMKTLKTGKAPGPDQLPVIAIKNYPAVVIQLLVIIFNACAAIGYYPRQWKKARTVAVHKPGKDPTLVESYRPVALLNILSKVFEKIIVMRLKTHIDIHNIIPNNQFGFRKKHGTTHALALLQRSIQFGFKKKLTTGVLSFDIEKAFDRVWHTGTLYKMIKFKFPSHLVRLIESFLSNRIYFVNVNDSNSPEFDIPWGLPQGSVLSPTLYNIFIADIPVQNLTAQLLLYADDTLLVAQDRLIGNVNGALQKSALTIFKFYDLWKIAINNDKTTLTCFTKRKKKQLPEEHLEVNGHKVKWENSLKYLGVTFDRRLTFRPHIEKTCMKFDAVLRLLYPYINKQSPLSKELKIHIYQTYLLPVLTYAAPVTVKMSKSGFRTLEVKQNKCLRMILGISWQDFVSNRRLEGLSKVRSLSQIACTLDTRFKTNCAESINELIRDLATRT